MKLNKFCAVTRTWHELTNLFLQHPYEVGTVNIMSVSYRRNLSHRTIKSPAGGYTNEPHQLPSIVTVGRRSCTPAESLHFAIRREAWAREKIIRTTSVAHSDFFPISPHPGEFLLSRCFIITFYPPPWAECHESSNREGQEGEGESTDAQSFEQVFLSLESSHSLGAVG